MNLMTSSPLHQLTRRQREVLRVLQRCRWRYAEAAQQLEMPVESVRTTVSRAMIRAKVEDSRELAYWLGVEDGPAGVL